MRFIIASLLVAYFLFFLYQISTADFLAKITNLDWLDWTALLFVPFLVLSIRYLTKYFRDERLTSRDIFWTSIIVVVFGFINIAMHVQRTEHLLMWAAFLATLGWIYTNYVNVLNLRRSHTMNVLIQMRNSAEFQRHRLNVSTRFPIGKPVTQGDVASLKQERADPSAYKDNKIPVMDSIVYLLNYYEFISVGVRTLDLDEHMIELTLRSILVTYFAHVSPIIDDRRSENPNVFTNYVALVTRFQKRPRRHPPPDWQPPDMAPASLS